MLLQKGYWYQWNSNPFCNDPYNLALDVNVVATLFEVITTFCPFTKNGIEAKYVCSNGANIKRDFH